MKPPVSISKLLHMDTQLLLIGSSADELTSKQQKLNDKLIDLATTKGAIPALQFFNNEVEKIDGECVWPPEWFQSKSLIRTLNIFNGNPISILNHYLQALNFLVLCRAIDDPLQWKADMDAHNEHLRGKIDTLYEVANEEIEAITSRFDRDKSMMSQIRSGIIDDVDLDGIDEHVQLFEQNARKRELELVGNWSLSGAFAKRGGSGKPDGIKHGWAVRMLSEYLPKDLSNRAALISSALSECANIEISRQNVAGILKKGKTGDKENNITKGGLHPGLLIGKK